MQDTEAATLTADSVRAQLDYDPETGVFARRIRYHHRRASTKAGNRNHDGYVQINLGGRKYQAHRLAWLWVYGEWPDGQVDHLNGDRGDNRLANLRLATPAINSQNKRRPQKNNRSGYLGVHRRPSGTFRAQIGVAGRTIKLGTFSTAAEAAEAYLQAKRDLHPGCTI